MARAPQTTPRDTAVVEALRLKARPSGIELRRSKPARQIPLNPFDSFPPGSRPPPLLPDLTPALKCARHEIAHKYGRRFAREEGVMSVCVGPNLVFAHFAPVSREPSVLVGRHSLCQLRLPACQQNAPLRHVLLLADGARRNRCIRVLDLRSELGVTLHGHGPIGSATLQRPGALLLGRSVLFFAHVRAGARLADTLPADLGSCKVAGHAGKPVIAGAHPPRGTFDDPFFSQTDAPTTAEAGLTLRLRTGATHESTLDVDSHDLKRGVLLGRDTLRKFGPGPSDSSVSRTHLALLLHRGQPVAVDLRSSTGTFLNGRRVDYARLDQGTHLWLGDQDGIELSVLSRH